MCIFPFVYKIVRRCLSVVQVLLSLAAPLNFHFDLLICERKQVEKTPLQSSVT